MTNLKKDYVPIIEENVTFSSIFSIKAELHFTLSNSSIHNGCAGDSRKRVYVTALRWKGNVKDGFATYKESWWLDENGNRIIE